jgi:hypothetical protein
VIGAEHARRGIDRHRVVAAQELSGGGQGEAAVGRLGEDSDRRRRPQQPVEGRRVRPGRGRELLRVVGVVAQQIRDPELGRDRDRARALVAADEVHPRERPTPE